MKPYKLYFIETDFVLKQMLFGSYETFDLAEYWMRKYMECIYDNVGEVAINKLADDCVKFQNENNSDFFVIRY